MTVPRVIAEPARRVTDMILEMMPKLRATMTPEERRLAIQLRGNQELLDSLSSIIKSRIEARASLPEPADPLECKSMAARDRELRWLLSRLEFIFRSPVHDGAQGEQPD